MLCESYPEAQETDHLVTWYRQKILKLHTLKTAELVQDFSPSRPRYPIWLSGWHFGGFRLPGMWKNLGRSVHSWTLRDTPIRQYSAVCQNQKIRTVFLPQINKFALLEVCNFKFLSRGVIVIRWHFFLSFHNFQSYFPPVMNICTFNGISFGSFWYYNNL